MKVDVLTLFPEVVLGPLSESIVGRARQNDLLQLNVVNIRDYATDKHHTVDDTPFGGGPGMVMRPDVLHHAIESCQEKNSRLILMSPAGEPFNQSMARELVHEEHLVIICGHYEGIDERVREIHQPLCLSIGDYVLTNGALAAAVVIDTITRLLPGCLGNRESVTEESLSEGDDLKYPQYTRPRVFLEKTVPDVLLSGDHAAIQEWRKMEALKRTREFKPTGGSRKEEKGL